MPLLLMDLIIGKMLYTRVYSKHEASYFHKQAFDSLKARADVGEMLSSQYAQEKRTNRK